MELIQIILQVGVSLIVSASIASYLHNRKQNKTPYNEAITKEVLGQIIEKDKLLPEDIIIDLGKSDQTLKPKKKRKYYPKNPKTNI